MGGRGEDLGVAHWKKSPLVFYQVPQPALNSTPNPTLKPL
jgi:hypothetical protein